MFTGLIEQIGRLVVKKQSGGARLTIHHDIWTEPLCIGESIAVSGVCLTVADMDASSFSCDVLVETLARTTLGSKDMHSSVNLERAMTAGGRLGGHIVSGHVDGVGKLITKRRSGKDWILGFTAETTLVEGILLKGSIACDGASLTVTSLSKTGFEVNIIPVTLQNTTMGIIEAGANVNLETDILGKYVRRHMDALREHSTLNMDTLKNAGFLK